MGTRHLILVYYKGEYHIAQYGQLDGYPSYVGVRILRFITGDDNLSKLKLNINKGLLYTPTAEQVNDWEAQAFDITQARQRQCMTDRASIDWEQERKEPMELVCPSLAAHTSVKILQLVADATDPVPIVKEIDFIADFLFCEWAYVIDLDEHILEVYAPGAMPIKGMESSRFNELECIRELQRPEGVTMMARFALDDLPDEEKFIQKCQGEDD